LTLQDRIDVLKDVAMSNEPQIGLPASDKQIGVVCILFKEFAEEADVKTVFAADDTWFRHRSLEKLFGHKSLKRLDMASVSALIDEMGTNFSGKWRLSDDGWGLLDEVLAELEEEHPTQEELL
jgi:hypothetical protein